MKIFPSRRKNSRVLSALASPTIRYLMRVSLFISCLLALSLQLSALHSNGQTIDQIEVTLEFRNARLSEVLRQIQDKAGINFVYSPDHISAWEHITVEREKRTVKKLLDLVLGETTLTYKEEAGTVVILKKKNTPAVLPGGTLTLEQTMFFQISGTVKDRNRVPLPGVNVVVKGTARGTSTDAEGKFSVDISEGDILVVSFIGYKTIEVSPENRTVVDIIMEEDITTLRAVEVFSTDYFSTTKEMSTMNISKVDGKDIQNQPVPNLVDALIGRMPGLDITPQSNFPGKASRVQIRGNNSLSARGSYPLYVVDGVQIESRPFEGGTGGNYDPLAGIDPNNIESVEVLKDAAATAIYGSRGANGVIRVTTKKAISEQSNTNLDLGLYTGVGKIANRVDLLNRDQYLDMRREAFYNSGTEPSIDAFDVDITGVWDTTRSTDWQKVLLGGTAKTTAINGAFSGGNGTTSFRVGGGYFRQTTVYPGDFSYQRVNGNFSFRHLSKDRKLEISAGVDLSYIDSKSYNNGSFVNLALTLPPVAPKIYNDDGSLNWQQYDFFGGTFRYHTWDNPMTGLLFKNNNNMTSLVAHNAIGYELFPGFKLKIMTSVSKIGNMEDGRSPIAAVPPSEQQYAKGSAFFNDNDRRTFMIEPQATFDKKFGEHRVNAVAGVTYQRSRSIYKSVEGRDYRSDAFLGSIRGANTVIFGADNDSQYKYASGYVHLGYSYADKFLVDLTGRRDGSSKFGSGKKYGNFGAVGIGWIFSEESLFKAQHFISFGKIRSSYGITGNDQIGDYEYLDSYTLVSLGYEDGVSLAPKGLFNPDYAWEITRKFEGALELGFVENRLQVEAAFYRNISTRQLVQYQLSATAGFPSVLANFDASIENSGFELFLSFRNIQRENFSWVTSFNFSAPRNKLLEFDGIDTSPYARTYKVGEPLSIRRLYTFKGVNSETGLYELDDVNGDGIYNDSDMKFSNPSGRTSYYGLTNSMTFGNFDLSFLVQFSNSSIADVMMINQPGSAFNQPVDVQGRWTSSKGFGDYQKFVPGYDPNYGYVLQSDRNIADASFVRLKTFSLGYSFSKEANRRILLQNSRLYFQCQNLFTLTKFNGFDPETGNSMPPLRIVSLGLQLKI